MLNSNVLTLELGLAEQNNSVWNIVCYHFPLSNFFLQYIFRVQRMQQTPNGIYMYFLKVGIYMGLVGDPCSKFLE